MAAKLILNVDETNDQQAFTKARNEELRSLISNGTFEVTNRRDIPMGLRILGSRFIDELKKADNRLRRKSRLVAQNYNEADDARISTKAPTFQRYSQRLLVSLAASFPEMRLFTRDVTQAYVQSTWLLC